MVVITLLSRESLLAMKLMMSLSLYSFAFMEDLMQKPSKRPCLVSEAMSTNLTQMLLVLKATVLTFEELVT
jgi:hypothetical protein